MTEGPLLELEAEQRAPVEIDDRPRCNARLRDGSGNRCRNVAGFKTEHVGVPGVPCALHGGCTSAHRTRAATIEAEHVAARALLAKEDSLEIGPADALLGALSFSATIVNRLQELAADDLAALERVAVYGALGSWLDRVARIARSAVDIDTDALRARDAQVVMDLFTIAGAALRDALGLTKEDMKRASAAIELELAPLEGLSYEEISARANAAARTDNQGGPTT